MNLDDDEDMLEVRADGLWSEGQGARLLEYDCHDVVTDVSLPQQLMEQTGDTQRRAKQTGHGHYGHMTREAASSP